MAMHHIAGKVDGVPAYRPIGTKRRDQDPKIYAQAQRDGERCRIPAWLDYPRR
jgi:L-alanine-DL-glutamate epimerase-like enolase superfamily enzyme